MPTNASSQSDPSLLGIYLNDHLAGATAGLELFRRAAANHAQTAAGPVLTRLTAEVGEDKQALLDVMGSLSVPVRHYEVVGGWLAEKAGRAKLNGRLLSRSPLSSVIELEGLRLGVLGKGSAWRLLRAVSDTEPRLRTEELDRLIERADRQAVELEELRIAAAREGLSP